jgi:Ni,Fe-hydrogenase I small subunit
VISLDYHEIQVAPSGDQAEESHDDVVKIHKGKYVAIVKGGVSLKECGAFLRAGARRNYEKGH